MPDFEPAESRRIGEGRFGLFSDVPAQFALHDRIEECAHFVLFASGENFHATVAQISDGAGNVEAFCYLPDGIAEANALDIPLIKDLNRCCHAVRRFIRRGRAATTERNN